MDEIIQLIDDSLNPDVVSLDLLFLKTIIHSIIPNPIEIQSIFAQIDNKKLNLSKRDQLFFEGIKFIKSQQEAIHLSISYVGESEYILDEMLGSLEELEDSSFKIEHLQTWVLFWKSEFLLNKGNIKAFKLIKQALKLSNSIKDLVVKTYIFNKMGIIISEMKTEEMENNYFEKARMIAKDNNYVMSRFLAVQHSTLENAQRLTSIANSIHHPLHSYYAYNLWFSYYWNRGELKKGLKYAKISLKTIEPSIFKSQKAHALQNLGVVYMILGEYEEASKVLKQGLEISNLPLILLNLGSLNYELGNLKTAISYFLQAKEILIHHVPFVNRLINIIANLVKCYVELGDFEATNRELKELERIVETSSIIRTKITLTLVRGIILRHDKKLRNRIRAIEFFEDYLESEYKHPYDHLYVMMNLCGLLLEEYRHDEDPETLNEIKTYVAKFELSSSKNRYPQSVTYSAIFRSKLALLDNEFNQSREIIRESLNYFNVRGIKGRYFEMLQKEFDQLLENQDQWIQAHELDIPMIQKLKLSRIEDYIRNAKQIVEENN